MGILAQAPVFTPDLIKYFDLSYNYGTFINIPAGLAHLEAIDSSPILRWRTSKIGA